MGEKMKEAYVSHNGFRESLYTGTSQKILDEILKNENFSVDGVSENRVRVIEADDKGELQGYLKHNAVLIRLHYFHSSFQQQMFIHVVDESRTLKKKEVNDIANIIKDIAVKTTKQIHQNPST